MSNKFNIQLFEDLSPFLEDNYTEYGVREYARKRKISAPTASKLLKGYTKAGLLESREERRMILFCANRESKVLKEISRGFWMMRLKGLADFIAEQLFYPEMILFGSITKLQYSSKSDIDIFVDTAPTDISLERFEENLKHPIQLHFRDRLANKPLADNILQGVRL